MTSDRGLRRGHDDRRGGRLARSTDAHGAHARGPIRPYAAPEPPARDLALAEPPAKSSKF